MRNLNKPELHNVDLDDDELAAALKVTKDKKPSLAKDIRRGIIITVCFTVVLGVSYWYLEMRDFSLEKLKDETLYIIAGLFAGYKGIKELVKRSGLW